ncbi:MAG: toluene tolerance protein [Betaproteobacteria bacterium HGW-Betaproteobacteria-12]|nr:MAG: toluene tolerance protein [Betaproteobacteria bacterium HGW-Betaproteobacteria-12]
MREGATVLEFDRFGDKVLRLADGTMLKLFRRKRLLTSAALFPYAQRFARNAAALAKADIPVPTVIAVWRLSELARDLVHYAPLAGITLRELVRAGLTPEDKRQRRDELTRFIVNLHNKGIYFRSLHIGNVVVTPDGRFGLIDFSDLRIYPWSLGKYLRARNMRRMLGIAAEADWVDLPAIVAGRAPGAGA